jgi:hypothetical protein
MPLVTCSDCQQPVSSEAIACPACARPMRDRSYLTPMGEVVVGGLVLIACIAWPPLWVFFLFVVVGRVVSRARRGSKLGAFIAGLALLVLTAGLVYVLPPAYSIILVVLGLACEVWLVVGRLRFMKTTT